MVRVLVERRLFLRGGKGTGNPVHDPLTGQFGKKVGGADAPVMKGPGGIVSVSGPVGGGVDPDVPKFKSAAEAEAWLKAKYGIGADLTAFRSPAELAALRGICSGLKDSISKYPSTAAVSLSSIRGNGSFCGQASSNGGVSSIVFDVRGVMNIQNGTIRTGGANWRAYTWQDSRGMVAHEMGHVYSFAMSDGGATATRAVSASIAKRAKLVPTSTLKAFPSAYSRSSDNEAFAEVFATTVNTKAKAYYTARPAAGKQLAGVVTDYNAAAADTGYPLLR